VKELRGFKRVTLKPGERKRVTLTLDVAQMAYLDQAMRLVVEPGEVTVTVGNSSADEAAQAKFRIVGPTLRLRKRRTFFNKVTVAKG
jgi:beta-glucosidase